MYILPETVTEIFLQFLAVGQVAPRVALGKVDSVLAVGCIGKARISVRSRAIRLGLGSVSTLEAHGL